MILSNPKTKCPSEILDSVVSLKAIQYIGFDGHVQNDGEIEVNKAVERDVRDFFVLAYQTRFPIASIVPASHRLYLWDDDKLMAANASSGFNYRTIAGTDRISWHARGLAIDVNPALNPYITYATDGNELISPLGAVYRPGEPGVFDADHTLVEFMIKRGWIWGGNFVGRIDYHHFEKPLQTH